MDIDTAPTDIRSVNLPAATTLSDKHECFAQHVAAGIPIGDAYSAVYPGASRLAALNHGSRLRARSDIQQRIRALQSIAAERTTVSAQALLVDLAAMADVDVADLWRLDYRPCPACHKLYDADLAARRPMPDLSDGLPPHPSCADVRSHQHVHMAPMEQWPAAARKLYDGLELQRDGTMRPVFRDRTQMADMTAKMLGAYVSRSENITMVAHVEPMKDLSPDAVLEFMTRQKLIQ
jgi:hypothetical protein